MTRHDYLEQLQIDEAGWHSAAKKWRAVVPLAFGYAIFRSRASNFETWTVAALTAFPFFAAAVFYGGKARRAREEIERLRALPQEPGDELPKDWALSRRPQRHAEIVRGCRWCALGGALVVSMLVILLPPYRVGRSPYVCPGGERFVLDLPRGAHIATDQLIPTLLWITLGTAIFVVAVGLLFPRTKSTSVGM